MGKKPKVRDTPQSLAKAIVTKIIALGLDRNKYVRGAAGELEKLGAAGRAGRYEKIEHGQRTEQNRKRKRRGIPKCYRARFTLMFDDYAEMGHLEKYLAEQSGELLGEYSFIKHPLNPENTKMRVIGIEESGDGHHATQRSALMKDLRTLDKILEKYAENL
jgi:hypothetical protein